MTQALYDSGFNSSSRLYEHAPSELGMTPATYGRGGRGINISYTIVASPMGRLLVAVTERGVCAVRMGDTDCRTRKRLRVSDARTRRCCFTRAGRKDPEPSPNKEPQLDLPLDIRSTAFQRQVWEQLRAIPYGQTVSYGEVAKALGKTGRGARSRACVCD